MNSIAIFFTSKLPFGIFLKVPDPSGNSIDGKSRSWHLIRKRQQAANRRQHIRLATECENNLIFLITDRAAEVSGLVEQCIYRYTEIVG